MYMQCLKTHPSIQIVDSFISPATEPLSWVGGIIKEKKLLFIEKYIAEMKFHKMCFFPTFH